MKVRCVYVWGINRLRVPSQARLSRLWKGYKRNTEIGHTNTDDTHEYIQRVNNNTCMHKQTHVRIHQERESQKMKIKFFRVKIVRGEILCNSTKWMQVEYSKLNLRLILKHGVSA